MKTQLIATFTNKANTLITSVVCRNNWVDGHYINKSIIVHQVVKLFSESTSFIIVFDRFTSKITL